MRLRLMVLLVFLCNGCSWLDQLLNKPCSDPNSCQCPTNKNPGCAPFPDDNGDNPSDMAKKKAKVTDGGTDR